MFTTRVINNKSRGNDCSLITKTCKSCGGFTPGKIIGLNPGVLTLPTISKRNHAKHLLISHIKDQSKDYSGRSESTLWHDGRSSRCHSRLSMHVVIKDSGYLFTENIQTFLIIGVCSTIEVLTLGIRLLYRKSSLDNSGCTDNRSPYMALSTHLPRLSDKIWDQNGKLADSGMPGKFTSKTNVPLMATKHLKQVSDVSGWWRNETTCSYSRRALFGQLILMRFWWRRRLVIQLLFWSLGWEPDRVKT